MTVHVANIMERDLREQYGIDCIAARIVVDIYFDREPYDPMAPDYEALSREPIADSRDAAEGPAVQ